MLFSILAPALSLWSLITLLLYYHHGRTKGTEYVELKVEYKIETYIKQFQFLLKDFYIKNRYSMLKNASNFVAHY